MPYNALVPFVGLSVPQSGWILVEPPMAEMMLAEFVATGAPLMFWFQGLFDGNRFWPSNCPMAGVAATPAAVPATNAASRFMRRLNCRIVQNNFTTECQPADHSAYPTNEMNQTDSKSGNGSGH